MGANIDYSGDVFVVTIGKNILKFQPTEGLYCMSPTTILALTKKELLEVELGQEVQRRLGFPDRSGVEAFIRIGAMLNVPIGTRAAGLLPLSIENVQGKSVEKRINLPPEVKSENKITVTRLHVDIFFVTEDIQKKSLPFFGSVTDFG